MSINDIYNELVKEVWANPHADRNAVVKMDLLTSRSGNAGVYYSALGFEVEMPTMRNPYVLFSAGVFLPYSFGIKNFYDGWNPLSDLIHLNQTVINIFSQGRLFTLTDSFFTVLKNGMVLLAVNPILNKKQLNLREDIYVRFYTNQVSIDNPSVPKIEARSYIHGVDNYTAFVAVISAINQVINSFVQVFKNGILYQNDIPPESSLVNGDTIDVILDPFIMGVNVFHLDTMNTFHSLKDGVAKQLLSLTTLGGASYVDDIEVYLTGINTNGDRVGVYFPRLMESDLRTLTSKDYSIDATRVAERMNTFLMFSDTGSLSQLEIAVYRRDNGVRKPILLDTNRIPDLMNLPVLLRQQVMLGVNANLEIWQASNLEACPYNTFISSVYDQLSPTLTNSVFSKHGISSLLERVVNNNGSYSLPINAIGKTGKLLKFNANGLNPTLENYTTPIASIINIPDSVGLEQFFPLADFTSPLDIVVNVGIIGNVNIPNGIDYLCYYLNSGNLEKASLGIDYTLLDESGVITIQWESHLLPYKRFVRLANRMVCYRKTLTTANIINGFNVYNGRVKANDIGMANLYIWLDGKYLIEDLDYSLDGEVVHLTSTFESFAAGSNVFVIYGGLTSDELRRTTVSNWGWIKHGKIDDVVRYDLLMYRNNMFFAGGKALPIDALTPNENYIDKSVLTDAGIVDGMPYAAVQPIRFLQDDLVKTICPNSLIDDYVDGNIKELLTILTNPVIDDTPIVLPNRYYLVSPFLNKITEEILNGNLVITRGDYNPLEIREITLPYINLLRIDPCIKNHNSAFVEIRPRWNEVPVGLSLLQYTFVEQVNEILLNGKVEGIPLYYHVTP